MNLPNRRVLIFSTAYLPLVGGAELAVKNLTDRLVDFEFDLVTAKIDASLPSQEVIGRVNVYRVGAGSQLDKLWLPIGGLVRALNLNRKNNYHVVWSIMASYGGFAGLFLKLLRPRIKFLLTLQEGDDLIYIKKRVGPFYFLFQLIFRRADYIQAISNYLADWARTMGTKCPIEVIPNGVDLEIFQPSWSADNLDKKNIVTVSRLVEKNGVHYLIEAMSGVSGELWIIGDGELKKELEQLAIDLKVKDRVKFLGNLSPVEVADKLAQASVFVRPSLSEGLGNAFLEAMAVGLPTIGTPVGGIIDFLHDGETGWICEVKDNRSIAEKINWIVNLANREKVLDVASVGQKLAREQYSWSTINIKMNKIFFKLERVEK